MSNFNEEDWINKRKSFKKKLNVDYLYDGILKQDRNILSSAITLIESELHVDKKTANELINKCLTHTGKAIRIGVTGVPGVGKSTFIEAFGLKLISEGKKVAVLSVDPSSETTKGSILGDKTRMDSLSKAEGAFIRPTSSQSHLGGVAKFTKESIILCEAAGYDVILIETVGVGQSETIVHSMVDFFLLLMLPGAGDELQGIKRGIMELADAVVITKAESEHLQVAKKTANYYKQALHYLPLKENSWQPNVLLYSCFDTNSLNNVYLFIKKFFDKIDVSILRKKQDIYWMYEYLKQFLLKDIDTLKKEELRKVELQLAENKINAFDAAVLLYGKLKSKNEKN
jgi:LAO/AO transport system kinase